MDTQLVRGSIPFMVVALLDDTPMHGYQLAETVVRRSAGRYQLNEATLYQTLHKLEAAGLVESSWQTSQGKRGRRIYRVLPAGRAWLDAKKAEWAVLVSLLEGVLDAGRQAS
jgi:DNA-binding PadR family transcriptional regulator